MNTTKRSTCPTCSPDRKRAIFDQTGSDDRPTWTCRNCHGEKPRRIMRERRAKRSAEFDTLLDLCGISAETRGQQ